MAKCAGCSGGLISVSHSDTNCIHLTGDGTSGSPLVATLQIDPASPAAITCGASGLSVEGGSSACAQKNMYTVSTVGPTGLGVYLGTAEPFLSCADFIGDGINDDVAIQTAVTASYSAYNVALPLPPEIYLNTGIFGLSASVDVKGAPLRGAYNTLITNAATATGFNLLRNPGYMTNLQLGELLAPLAEAPIVIDTPTGFPPYFDNVSVASNGIGVDPGMIFFTISASYRIQNCDIDNNTATAVIPGIYESNNSVPLRRILNNRFVGASIDLIEHSGANAQIRDNIFYGNSTTPVVGDRGMINILLTGAFTVQHHEISGNHITDSPGHGIVINGGAGGGQALRFLIHDNLIDNYGYTGTNAYDGIFLAGNSDEHDIQGNICHSTQAGARHGVNVSAVTCNDNFVTNNNLLNSGASASFNDAGTTTISAAGNRL